jgi:hypothetical protein
MTIAATDIGAVPVARILRLIGLARRGFWSFGETFCAPSPRAPSKHQRCHIADLKVSRSGKWSDAFSNRVGPDPISLLAYCDGTSRAAALAKLSAVCSVGDTLLDRRITPSERAGPAADEAEDLGPTSPAADQSLRKFASSAAPPRIKAAALLQAATNARALDAVEDRKAGRR